ARHSDREERLDRTQGRRPDQPHCGSIELPRYRLADLNGTTQEPSAMTHTISHRTTQINDAESTNALVRQIEERLRSAERLVLPLNRTLDLLHQLKEFELGRFLLHNRGLNGYWTAYVFQHGFGKPPENELGQWLLHKSLLVRA